MRKHKMKRHTRFALIFIVVAATLGGFAVHYLGGGAEARADRVVERISSRLDLNDIQRQQLQQLKSEVMTIRAEWRASRAQAAQDVMEVILAPTLDQDRLLAMLEQRTTTVNRRAPEVVTALASFTDSLNASQKAEIRDTLDDKISRWQQWSSH